MWRFLRNRRLILRLHYYLGASRGGPCDSTALVTVSYGNNWGNRMCYLLYPSFAGIWWQCFNGWNPENVSTYPWTPTTNSAASRSRKSRKKWNNGNWMCDLMNSGARLYRTGTRHISSTLATSLFQLTLESRKVCVAGACPGSGIVFWKRGISFYRAMLAQSVVMQ